MTTNNSDVRAKLAYCVLGLEDTIKTAEEQKDATALYAKKTLTHAASLLLHDVEKYRKIVKLAGRLGGTRVGEVGTRGASPRKQQAKAANAKPTLLELFAEIAALGLHDCSDLVDMPEGVSAHEFGISKMVETYDDPDPEFQGSVNAITQVGTIASLLHLMNRDFAVVARPSELRPRPQRERNRPSSVLMTFDGVRKRADRSVSVRDGHVISEYAEPLRHMASMAISPDLRQHWVPSRQRCEPAYSSQRMPEPLVWVCCCSEEGEVALASCPRHMADRLDGQSHTVSTTQARNCDRSAERRRGHGEIADRAQPSGEDTEAGQSAE